MSIALLIPLLMVIGVVVAVVVTLFSVAEDQRVARESLSQIDGYDIQNSTPDLRQEQLSGSIKDRAIIPAIQAGLDFGKRITPMGYVDKVRHKFTIGGVTSPDAVDRFLATKSILVPLGIAFGLSNAIFGFLGLSGLLNLAASALIGFAIGYYPDIKLTKLVETRQKQILRSLPDVLDLLTISVEAGLGFEQALDRVVEQVPGPLSDEFIRMLGESRSGTSRADAMRAMDERIDVAEVRSFVLAIVQADQFGVSIGRVLRAQSEEMRIKRRQLAQEQAQKAPVKMLIPRVFCIVPALFVVVLGPAALNIRETF